MRLRPQYQLRFRDIGQFESAQKQAADAGISMNEFLLLLIEVKVPATPEEKVVKAKEK